MKWLHRFTVAQQNALAFLVAGLVVVVVFMVVTL